MKITDAFLGEHGAFHAQLEHIGRTSGEWGTLAQPQAEAGLLLSALGGHARLEEDLLFVAMEPYVGGEGGPLEVMRQEHNVIEETLTRAKAAPDLTTARELMLHLTQVALEHFGKEEQVLFPMAEQVLDEETQLRLGEEWAGARLSRSGFPAGAGSSAPFGP